MIEITSSITTYSGVIDEQIRFVITTDKNIPYYYWSKWEQPIFIDDDGNCFIKPHPKDDRKKKQRNEYIPHPTKPTKKPMVKNPDYIPPPEPSKELLGFEYQYLDKQLEDEFGIEIKR